MRDMMGKGRHRGGSAVAWAQSGSDVGAELTKWGVWQPSLRHDRGPTALEALIGGLESTGTASRVPRLYPTLSSCMSAVISSALATQSVWTSSLRAGCHVLLEDSVPGERAA